jgi:hypothetical protein
VWTDSSGAREDGLLNAAMVHSAFVNVSHNFLPAEGLPTFQIALFLSKRNYKAE